MQPEMLKALNPATGLVLDFSVDIEDVASAAGISTRAVREAIKKTVKFRRYKWRGRRLKANQVLTADFLHTNQYLIRVSSLSDELQVILIAKSLAALRASLAGRKL